MKTSSARRRTTALALALLALPAAHAARPMITDDARIVDAKACQVEAWVRRNPDSIELWAVPACNPWENLELTLGGAHTHDHERSGFSDAVVQAKSVLRPLADDWGLALAAGTTHHPRRESANDWPGDPYVNAALTFKARDDDWLVHLNAGAVRRRDEGRTQATWGFGHEIRLSPRVFLIPEVFSADRGRPFYQAGVRYWVVKDRLQMDATCGNRAVSDGRERWFSIGLRVLAPPFLL